MATTEIYNVEKRGFVSFKWLLVANFKNIAFWNQMILSDSFINKKPDLI